MMERIADHLTFLSMYAAGFQNSEIVQKVRVIIFMYSYYLSISL